MTKYLLKRIGFALLTLLIASSLLFSLLQLMPGAPYENKLDETTKEQIKDEYDLDEPVALQYVKFFGGVLGFKIEIDDGSVQGVDYKGMPQFGRQWAPTKAPVSTIIGNQYPLSMFIGFQGLIMGLIAGLIFGVVSALRRNTAWDHILTMVAVVGVSVPSFVFASVLQYFIGFKLGVFPITYEINNMFSSSILPAFALSLFVTASLTRFMRTELVDVLGSDYILLARAKGLSKNKVIVRHAIRNALIPVITVLGPLTLAILSGSVVVEKIFTIPGMGGELVSAIQNYDNPVILGIAFFYSALYILVILLVDISYGIIDPRVRVQGGDK